MEEGRLSPFPSRNLSDKIEPLFTAPRRAWISHQITTQMNDLSDELFIRVKQSEEKLEKAMKTIEAQNIKIDIQETKIFDLLTAKDEHKIEVETLKQKITEQQKSTQKPAIRQECSNLPSSNPQTSQQEASDSMTSKPQIEATIQQTSSTMDEDPPLPPPSRPSQWAENWSKTKQKAPPLH